MSPHVVTEFLVPMLVGLAWQARMYEDHSKFVLGAACVNVRSSGKWNKSDGTEHRAPTAATATTATTTSVR
jgi:hypothetical protein